jgi:hypothetical protein
MGQLIISEETECRRSRGGQYMNTSWIGPR